MEAAIKSSIFSLVREKKISVDFPETTNPPVTKKKKKVVFTGFFLLYFPQEYIPLDGDTRIQTKRRQCLSTSLCPSAPSIRLMPLPPLGTFPLTYCMLLATCPASILPAKLMKKL